MKRMLYAASNMTHIRHFHLEMIEKLGERGWQVDLACRGAPEQVRGAETCIDVPFSKQISFFRNRKAIAQLRRLLKTGNYDILFCHTSLAAFFVRLVLLGRKKRPYVVNMVHGYLFDEHTNPWKRRILSAAEALAAPVTDLILTMNAWDTEYAQKEKLGKRVIRTKGLGIDFSRFPALPPDRRALRRRLDLPEDACLLVYPAEFSARKNQSFLIRLLERLPEEVCLLLPGEGALLSECRELARERGLEARVFFPGYQRELNPWLRAADISVSASRIEGLPANILEAMYCGLPVVASRIKGHTDLVREGETGFLCEGEAQWVDRLTQLTADADLRRRMGAEGMRDAAEYDRMRCTDALLRTLGIGETPVTAESGNWEYIH